MLKKKPTKSSLNQVKNKGSILKEKIGKLRNFFIFKYKTFASWVDLEIIKMFSLKTILNIREQEIIFCYFE